MVSKEFYDELYELLENVTPLMVDCGGLCNGACCKGDGETGMYLFPGEEAEYDGSEKWLKIYESDFIFENKPVKIAICDGTCERKKRPLSCRIFPLFIDEKGKLVPDARGKWLCPLVTANIEFDQYDPLFIENVTKVFKKLMENEVTQKYIKETQEIIKEHCKLNDIFTLKK